MPLIGANWVKHRILNITYITSSFNCVEHVLFLQVIEDYKDFAFSDYARVGRAVVLYEIGDREQSIAEMEDVSISLKGYPEVHAALAAALYADKNAPLLAENQFTIATLLDPHYTDLSYVRETKHWPPSLVSSLQHFITLTWRWYKSNTILLHKYIYSLCILIYTT